MKIDKTSTYKMEMDQAEFEKLYEIVRQACNSAISGPKADGMYSRLWTAFKDANNK